MNQCKYVILGGGMAAGYAAKELAERGVKAGELAIVSADTAVPYERPPLSKGFLAGKEDEAKIRINPEEFYGERGIELKLKTEVAGVDTEKRLLQLQSGEQLGFEKLMVATGAAVRTLEVPGADLEGIFYLRSLDDSKRIRLRAEGARKAVVIGSGFIGMEVASVLAQKGVETAMVIREDRIWPKFFSPAMSKNFEAYFSERGVRFLKRASVAEVKRDRELKVVTQDGRGLSCDMLVAGIGVRPAVDVLMDSGIELGDGIPVNSFLETSEPGVYAAGDVANYEDTLFGVRRRAEHWDNAVSQGQHCARVMTGERKPFVHVPYFFSDVFDLSYEYWGDGTGADEMIERGDLSTSSFSVWWLRDKRLIAAFVMNRPDQERSAAPQWIESKRHLVADELREDRWPTA
jgi:NADPH-dependent 2,4-dienoyl-CoA reductase/sulfur reductase-like enzyme